jgi:beta-glucosidase
MFEQLPAVLAAWRPGEEGGTAVWNIISGAVNPSGRTAHTWPRTVGQVHQYVPWFLPRGTRTGVYGDFQPATPLVSFGYGESYSRFTFTNVVRCSFFKMSLHSRIPLDPMHVCLK